MTAPPGTVDHALRVAADDVGDRDFLHIDGQVLTYGDLEDATGRVANGLLTLGLAPGDHVAVLMRNRLEFVLAWLGANRAGMPSVPVNAGLRGDGLVHVLDHSEASLLVVEAELLPEVLAVRDRLRHLQHIVVVGDADGPGSLPWSVLATGRSGAPTGMAQPESTMSIMYTSGTTGHPKGVVIPQQRLRGGPIVLDLAGAGPDDIAYTSLPLFHSNAAIVSFWGAFGLRIPLVLGRRFSASRHWDDIRSSGATFFNAIGAMIPILWKQPEHENDADNPCRFVLSAACPTDLWVPFEERFDLEVVEFYGTSEGGLTMGGPAAPVGSIGKPAPGNHFEVHRDDGTPCDPREVGALVCRPNVAETPQVRYFKDPEASERKTAGGWLRTGDRAWMDEDGWLYFVDRDDHFMRRRGENVSSTEVEAVVDQHPDVLESAAYPIPSELAEDDIAVAVRPRAGRTIDPADLIAFCEPRMAAHQLPRYVRVVDELPKTETHRAQKVSLRRDGLTTDTWDREHGRPVGAPLQAGRPT